MIVLPDVNVLVGIVWPTHVHHHVARSWFDQIADTGWATTPQTEQGFLRMCMNASVVSRPTSAGQAIAMISALRDVGRHEFWPDDVDAVSFLPAASHIQGYRQITDTHLLLLAQRHNGVVATLDRGMAQLPGPSESILPA